MKEIRLTQGYVAQVDDEDYEWLNQWMWYAHKDDDHITARRNSKVCAGKRSAILMHRLIMGLADSKVFVDHRDGDALNNQRSNLREASCSENNKNQKPHRDKVKSTHKGVRRLPSDRWASKIVVDRKDVYLGAYDTEELAAIAYNEAAIKYHGEFARLNVISNKNQPL